MKKYIYKLISSLLVLVLIMTTLLPSIAIAANDDVVDCTNKKELEDVKVSISLENAKDSEVIMKKNLTKNIDTEVKESPKKVQTENKIEDSGEGTPEDPKVTTTTKVTTDDENKETTTTITKEKEWHNDNVDGHEDSKVVETVDEDSNLVSASGNAQGEETTTIKNEEDTEVVDEREIEVKNGQAETQDGEKIETGNPEITIELEPGITQEKTADMDAWYDEDTLGIPDWIRQKNGETSTWITDNSSNEEDGTITNITVNKEESSTTYTRKITKPNGTTTEEKITYTRDAKGRITGYETETKETISETTEETTPPANAEIHADGTWKALAYELPEKPEVPVAEKDENGKVLNGKVVSEIYDEDGRLAGYTELEIKDGKIVKYSDPIIGKLICRETKVETLENGLKNYTLIKTSLTRKIGKKTSGQVKDGERTLIGEMGQIDGFVVFDQESLKTFLPDFTIAGPNGEGFNDEQDIAKVNSSFVKDYDENGQYFQWLGQLGLFSQIYIRDGDGDYVQADQFEITGKDGKKYYAYCADLNVYAQEGAHYNMQRLEDADYIEHKDKIRSIVLKGYWGVKNESDDPNKPSVGSLEAFRKMLLDNHVLTEEESNKLTHGMALLATQAAIWRYGNSGQNMLKEELDFPFLDEGQKTSIINKTYKYLVGLEGTQATASNTIFKKDDFAKMVDLTVKEKLEDDKYNTDVKIAMAVEFDDETSDLKLFITADGEKVDEFRLSGALQEGEKKARKNPDGTYTLAGLALRGNRKFNINLKGVQNLKDGVYIFSCDKGPNGHPAQTLIGAGDSKEDIDLNVDLEFNVKEKVTYTSQKSESEIKNIEWQAAYYTFEETPDTFDQESPETPIEEIDIPEDDDDEKDSEKEEETDIDIEKLKEIEETETEIEKTGIVEDTIVTKKIIRRPRVPKTGDSLYQIQMFLMSGALINLFAAAFFANKKDKG